MQDFVAYFNGNWLPHSECKLHIDDRGVRLGDAVYDVERTFVARSSTSKATLTDSIGHLDTCGSIPA